MSLVRSHISRRALSRRLLQCACALSLTAQAELADSAGDHLADVTRPARSPFPEHTTVGELLKLDTEAALQAARRAAVGAFDASPAGVSSERKVSTGNAVLAIYGTGRALTAEVQIGARLLVFQSSRRRPLSGGPSVYALDLIHPPCVHLRNGQKKEVLCLEQGKP